MEVASEVLGKSKFLFVLGNVTLGKCKWAPNPLRSHCAHSSLLIELLVTDSRAIWLLVAAKSITALWPAKSSGTEISGTSTTDSAVGSTYGLCRADRGSFPGKGGLAA